MMSSRFSLTLETSGAVRPLALPVIGGGGFFHCLDALRGNRAMAAATSGPHTQDIPFTVQGYVTDPKLVGYQVLTNYESTYWRALLGNDAWGLYEVLRSFCHEGNTTCYPSVNLLLSILGLKQRRVLTGWVTLVNGKEYRYPGLIEILQEHKLAVAEVQGEGPKMRYVFHVNMTPALLTDTQLSQLPNVLQKKHAELLERCEQALQQMEAKRRPPKVEISPPNGQAEGYDNLSEGYDNLSEGYDNLSPKQHPINNTHITRASVHEDHNNNSGGDPNDQTDVVVALVALGISKGVAQRLAGRYSRDRILEKVEFLEFLTKEAPDKVQNPHGWLRRAIEEDYGAPDGYLSKDEQERLEAEEAKRAEEEELRAEAVEDLNRAFQEQYKAERSARIRRVREGYSTTEGDLAFWEQAKFEFKCTSTPEISLLIAELEILSIRDGTVTLGAWTETEWRQLQHPGTVKLISRSLSQVAGRPVELQVVALQNEG